MNAGTKLKLLTKQGLHFRGEVQADNELFLEIKDKYGKTVCLNKTDISLIEVLD